MLARSSRSFLNQLYFLKSNRINFSYLIIPEKDFFVQKKKTSHLRFLLKYLTIRFRIILKHIFFFTKLNL